MIDADDILRTELHRLSRGDARPDWEDVLARAGLSRRRVRRRRLLAAVLAAGAVAVGAATPLGSAIAKGVDDFSAWLTGQPGDPVSEEEQRAFEEQNARSWLSFPEGTQLRRLITYTRDGTQVELLGFRAGSSSLCLRIRASGHVRGQTSTCAPLAELRRDGAPVRVAVVDHGFGRGEFAEWYGIDRIRSSALQVSAGIVADGVRSVVLQDEAGRHEVDVQSNAFLYVAERPRVGQRVTRIWARIGAGLVPVPFAPAPFLYGGKAASRPAPPAPAVERTLRSGRIGWLDAREERGEPLDVLPPQARTTVLGREVGPGPLVRRSRDVVFGRLLAPDPDRPVRIAVTLNAHRAGGPPAGLCTWLLTRGGLASGGCSPYPEVFARMPMNVGFSFHGPSAFMTANGAASDEVARLEALLADGRRVQVPLRDNVFVVDLPRADLPARLVAYDAQDRVVGVTDALADVGRHAGPARGRAVSLWRVRGPNGAHAELFVGRSTAGGECMFVKQYIGPRHAGVMVMCEPPRWRNGPLELSGGTPFISGRVRSHVKLVRMKFAGASSRTVRPRRGYLLVSSSSDLVSAEAIGADGQVVGRFSFPRPGG